MTSSSRWKLAPAFRILLSVILVLLLLLSPATGVAWGRGDVPEKPLEISDHNPKLESRLELIFRAKGQQGQSVARRLSRGNGVAGTGSSTLEVVVEEQEGRSIFPSAIRAVGGEILGQAEGLIKVRLPVERIETLAEEVEGVRYVRSPYTPSTPHPRTNRSDSSSLSTGVNLIGGSVYQANNYLGDGVKIAVVDLGFASLDYARNSGQLTESAIAGLEDYTGTGISSGTAHGTGVAGIVHQIAPEAGLYLKKIGDEIDLAEATGDAISQEVDVIVHSVGWLNTNFGDGTGVVADIAREATRAGILWVNAAGNLARRHWQGPVSDRDEDGWVEFGYEEEAITVNNESSRNIGLYLTWNDWPTTEVDFDLFLYDQDGNLVRSSRNHQTGNEPPTERINYSPPSSGGHYLKVSGPEDLQAFELEIFSLNQSLEPAVEEGSILAPGNAEEVYTVGAVDASNWSSGPIEYFSSRGPTANGKVKPDLTGIDGVTTYVYRDFLGTSAAAPSVAGAAALILSRSPELEADQLKEALAEDAKDLGEEGRDNTYGAGGLRLIFENPSVTRELEGQRGPEVVPGDSFTVRLTAGMPLTLQGGLAVEERLPEPLEVLEVVEPDATGELDDREVRFEWPIVEPGGSREAEYKVFVPEGTQPGEYEITGTINGKTTEATEVSVTAREEGSRWRAKGLVLEETRAVMDRASSEVDFGVEGEGLYRIRVQVYSLTGKEVFDSQWREGHTFQWNLLDNRGASVPNGVYFYSVTVEGPEGKTERSELNRVLVLR